MTNITNCHFSEITGIIIALKRKIHHKQWSLRFDERLNGAIYLDQSYSARLQTITVINITIITPAYYS